ncbi:MAG: DNA-directed RNA polymerase subunit beta', partial [Verrucomicrobia bacterium]|nr:DNA-directed RNA polymerase subunit beta' [Verrucomicrobiota bacterium]
CGLPKKMALVLFEPFIIRRLKDRGIVHTVRSAKKMIERQSDEVWDILEEVTKDKTVMLNRAPTLHRLSVQSFEPVLVEGEAIRIHPLVCTAFNADFDGDQMAVHVPLSIEAQLESRLLMMSTNSIFSPSSGRSVMTPTQDIALGIYYLTALSQAERRKAYLRPKGERNEESLPIMLDEDEVRLAYQDGALQVHSMIRYKNPDKGLDTEFGESDAKIIITTVGRVLFNDVWPKKNRVRPGNALKQSSHENDIQERHLGFVNKLVDKNMLGDLIWHCHNIYGHKATVTVLDALKRTGFEHATLAGVSIGLVDMIIPPEKEDIVQRARNSVAEVEKQYKNGVITEGERYNKIVDIWTHSTDEISNAMYRRIEENETSLETNPVFMMVDSRARGSRQQIRQLAGMRGLMAKPSGEIIEKPIVSNFREGLSVLEYFISTHGARKGLADTALKTADAGYLTRKLVDVAQDVIAFEQDCNTVNGIETAAISEGDEVLVSLTSRILGRTSVDEHRDPITRELIVSANGDIDEGVCAKLEKVGVDRIRIRSVLTCEARRGICVKCYGRDLSTGKPIEIGTAAGIIAAQSIGEPGTQLTMRTFHIGGTASAVFKQPSVSVKLGGLVRYHDLRTVQNAEGDYVVLNKNGAVSVHDETGHELERHTMPMGALIKIKDAATIAAGKRLAEWDPYSVPVLAEQAGRVRFHDFVENVSVKKEIDEGTGLEGTVVLETKEDLHPQIIVHSDATSEVLGFYSIPAGAHVIVKHDQKVLPGETLAKTPRKESKTKDITGGLPRVAELFEARQPKDAAEIAKIEGVVDFGPNQRGRRCLIIRDETTGGTEEHLIAMGKHIVVFKDDRVKKGQQLTEGPVVPQEILEVCGPVELQNYLVDEVQQVYRLQGVEINDKHIEVIVRQMLRKVTVTNPGDTEFLWGEAVTKQRFVEINEAALNEGKRPAEATPALLGITKASLETD